MVLVLKGLVIIIFAHFVSFYIFSKLTPYGKDLKEVLFMGIAALFIMALIKNPYISFLAVGTYFFIRTKTYPPEKRIFLYFGLLFLVSNSFVIQLTLGINMGQFNFQTFLSLVLLVPLFFAGRGKRKNNVLDTMVIIFFVFIMLSNLRGGVTHALRQDLWLFAGTFIPYMVVKNNVKNLKYIFTAMGFALLAQSLVAIAEGGLSWALYRSVEYGFGFPKVKLGGYVFRNGFLRSSASHANSLVGSLFFNFSFLVAWTFLLKKEHSYKQKGILMYVLVLLFAGIASTFLTGSRAGMAGLFLIVFIHWGCKWIIKKRINRPFAFFGVLLVVIIGLVKMEPYLEEVFGYRYRLIMVAKQVIGDNFLFGSLEAREDPRMEVMRQGQGIIDIVNSYLWYTMFYGVPVTLLMIAIFISAVEKLFKRLSTEEISNRAPGMFLLVSIIIVMFNIATTSPLDRTFVWLWLLVAMTSAYVTNVAQNKSPKKVFRDSIN